MALYPFPSTQAGAHGVAREELRWQADNSPYFFTKASGRKGSGGDLHGGSSPQLKRVTEENEAELEQGGGGVEAGIAARVRRGDAAAPAVVGSSGGGGA